MPALASQVKQDVQEHSTALSAAWDILAFTGLAAKSSFWNILHFAQHVPARVLETRAWLPV